jgi:energy-coupling factor transport system substrate-specific component
MTTEISDLTTDRPTLAGLPRRLALGLGFSALAGVVVYLVLHATLPDDATFSDTALSSLALPAGLAVLFAGTATVAAIDAHVRWRVVDIVVASVLGVAGGLVFWVFNTAWEPITGALAFFPPLSAVLVGVWLFPAVLGGLIIRKPGAAVYTEVVAATVAALLGNKWGFSSVWYGLVEGLGAEVVFALLLYRAFGLVPALLAGAGAGVTVGVMDAFLYFPTFSAGYKLAYVVLAVASGVVIAGLGSWALTRALAATGALAPLPSGRVAERV